VRAPALYALSIGVALALSALLIVGTGGSATDVVDALLDGSLRNPGRWGDTVNVAAPILLVALGAIVSSKAGLVVLVALLVAGAVGGGLWAGIPGVLRYRRGVPEVLTSLLLVTVAANLVGYGLKREGLLLGPAGERADRDQISEQLDPSARLPRLDLFGNELSFGALLAVALAAVVAAVLVWTVWGFRLRILGSNPRVARRAGVAESRYGMGAMLASGAFAGLAGAVMLAGGDFGRYQLVPGFSVSIGWTGLLVALVARGRASVAVGVALVFAALRTGSGFLAATGVERRITDVVQALLVLALLIPPAILFLQDRRRLAAAARAQG
jgi:ABC-type uncharacterized transport system permease subunit